MLSTFHGNNSAIGSHFLNLRCQEKGAARPGGQARGRVDKSETVSLQILLPRLDGKDLPRLGNTWGKA
jgi:hypothetical protein